MKRLIPLLTLIFVAFAIPAQMNTAIKIFSKKDNSDITGTSYDIYGDGATSIIKEEFKTVLTTADSMRVAVKRWELSSIPGTYEYFCWYVCYPRMAAGVNHLFAPEDSITLYKNDTILNFSVYLEPELNMGTGCYRYVLVPGENPADSSYLDVCFKIETVGLNEFNKVDMSIYPNPANNYLYVEGEDAKLAGALIRIFDTSGKLLKEEMINSGLNTLDVSTLPEGMYLGKIHSDEGELLSAKKIVIY